MDERFFWQWSDYTAGIANDTTWTSFIGTLTAALGITLSPPSISGDYRTRPHPLSDFDNQYENAALALDAVFANIGLTFVRSLDTTYTALSSAASDAIVTTNLTNCTEIMAGGDCLTAFEPAGLGNQAVNAILPSQVDVVFRLYLNDVGYDNPDFGHVPFSRNEGDCYVPTVALSDLTVGGKSWVGNGATKTIHTTAEAYEDYSGVYNTAQITALATQLAQDYYDWQLYGKETTFASIANWQPEGVYDIEWHYLPTACKTVVHRRPYNYQIEQYQHHFYNTHWVTPTRTPLTVQDSYGSTTISSSISTGIQTVTPVSMAGINIGDVYGIGTPGVDFEYVTVTSITSTTFDANFTVAHTGPVAVQGVVISPCYDLIFVKPDLVLAYDGTVTYVSQFVVDTTDTLSTVKHTTEIDFDQTQGFTVTGSSVVAEVSIQDASPPHLGLFPQEHKLLQGRKSLPIWLLVMLVFICLDRTMATVATWHLPNGNKLAGQVPTKGGRLRAV